MLLLQQCEKLVYFYKKIHTKTMHIFPTCIICDMPQYYRLKNICKRAPSEGHTH